MWDRNESIAWEERSRELLRESAQWHLHPGRRHESVTAQPGIPPGPRLVGVLAGRAGLAAPRATVHWQH
jgi:hypothetical protein